MLRASLREERPVMEARKRHFRPHWQAFQLRNAGAGERIEHRPTGSRGAVV